MSDKPKEESGTPNPSLPEEDMWDKAAKGFKVVRNQLQNVVVTLNVSPEFVRRYKEYQAKEAKNHPKKK